MKKALTLFTLAIICAMTMAQERRLDDDTLKRRIFRAYDGHLDPADEEGLTFHHKPEPPELANEYGISHERMARVLEEMIREHLPQLTDKKTGGYGSPFIVLRGLLKNLETYQSANTLALLKECATSVNRDTRYHAVKTYATIAGVESIPPLLEAIEAKRFTTEQGDFYGLLGKVVEELNEKNRDNDVEKILIFMLNMAQREDDNISVFHLDYVLCVSTKDYITSVQRTRLIQRFENDNDRAIRDSLAHAKSELEKIPVNERTDLSKRFKLMEQPKEKGEN